MTELAREYGEGLFLLCQEERLLERVEADLDALKALFAAEPEYGRLLSSRAVPKAERLRLCDEALRGRVHPYALNFVKILIERGALHELGDCAAHYHTRALEAEGVVEARVTSARPLTQAQSEALIKRLRQLSGMKVVLAVTVDPSVIGGLRVDMQHKRYDNTIQHRMELMRRHLTGDL